MTSYFWRWAELLLGLSLMFGTVVGCEYKAPEIKSGTISAPTHVEASITAEHAVRVTWDEVVVKEGSTSSMDADSYVVYRADTFDGSYLPLSEELPDARFVDESIEAKYRSFYYRVKALTGRGQESEFSEAASANPSQLEDELLDSTFTINIETITAEFDFYPATAELEAQASLEFSMRPEQTKPRFHFAAATDEHFPGDELLSMTLDGKVINIDDPAELRIVSIPGTAQQLLEVQRELIDGVEHTIEVTYRLMVPTANNKPYFYTTTWDIGGSGNERRFPCLNTPGELARHELIFRLHDGTDYHFVGSGPVVQDPDPAPSVSQWRLDTQIAVPSSTVMFGFLPAEIMAMAKAVHEVRMINGIEVSVLAFVSIFDPKWDLYNLEEAFQTLEEFLPALEDDFGSPPTTHLTVVLQSHDLMIGWPGAGSMEFYGAMETNIMSLRHELLHQYFGCGVLFKTYRDTWLDEAIAAWYTNRINDSVQDNFSSDMVSFVSPTTNEFHRDAYTVGPEIIQRFAIAAGGRDQMNDFLRHLYENHAFEPMSTIDFIRYFAEFTGQVMYEPMMEWVFDGERDY